MNSMKNTLFDTECIEKYTVDLGWTNHMLCVYIFSLPFTSYVEMSESVVSSHSVFDWRGANESGIVQRIR